MLDLLRLFAAAHGPCSLCRAAAVERLAAQGAIPDWMAEEGRFDADPSIAERFGEASA